MPKSDTTIVDINHTPLEEMTTVPGLGPVVASRIISNRPFDSLEALIRVPGIGPHLFERLSPYLSISSVAVIKTTPPKPEINADINYADKEELTAVPGLGPVAAARIIKNRPYDALEDLIRIPGIGPRLLERLIPYLSISPSTQGATDLHSSEYIETEAVPSEEVKVLESSAPVIDATELDESIAWQEPSVPAETLLEDFSEPTPIEAKTVADEQAAELPTKEAKQPVTLVPVRPQPKKETPGRSESRRPVNRIEIMSYALGAGILTLILAISLSLGLLSLINSGLSFASANQINQLQRQVDGLDSHAGTLQQDINSLRSRLDSMEAISGRVNDLENEFETVRSELKTNSQQILRFESQLQQITEQTAQIEQRTAIFERFLEGLHSVLTDIFPSPTE